jgi:hypothetical protein
LGARRAIALLFSPLPTVTLPSFYSHVPCARRAIALLASGQSSTITGTYAGQFVMQGFVDLSLPLWCVVGCLSHSPRSGQGGVGGGRSRGRAAG